MILVTIHRDFSACLLKKILGVFTANVANITAIEICVNPDLGAIFTNAKIGLS